MTSDAGIALDRTDRAILDVLQRDGRLSFLAVGRLVNLSGPAVRERVRRLEQAGVIRGYGARVDPAAAGHPVLAFVRMGCIGPGCIRTEYTPQRFPEILELHRLSGGDCSILKVVTPTVARLEQLIDRLAAYGKPTTSLVLSTVAEHRPVPGIA
jgi:Lrp/AsnC family leucine-responsive transcriptional regulator